ncbi:unnamed protein product [Moneuplotes crassus]|uniref:Myosin motor domain-containing protein n=2 Tax=Euplotes crassus TaxID=5936 RepID=A0AAD1X3G4_EUPCR|nr:unnamed protein product [Moneuplotes crassus]
MFSDEEIKEMLVEAASQKVSAQLNIGEFCWFRNEEYDENDMSGDSYPFFVGKVKDLDEENELVTLETNTDRSPCNEYKYLEGPFQISKTMTMEYSEDAEEGIRDMIDLNELNHSTLLFNMKKRYVRDDINTFVGPTLLIINPFKKIPNVMSEETIERYMSIITAENMLQRKKELDPHIFSVAATAFRQLKENKQKQAIVISGESGAGKTESAKIAMKFLTALSSLSGEGKEEKKVEEGEATIEKKILDCNPVLEAFGNAKTVRNNNSSRFGKYVKLVFNLRRGDILGAETLNYLLEKSRVCKQSSEERNYHIFYHLIKGADLEMLKQLRLTVDDERPDYTMFNYLREGTDFPDDTVLDDKALYDELIQVFKDLNFTDEEQYGVWRTVAACLKIGEIEFSEENFDESGVPCDITNKNILEDVAFLLGMEDPHDLEVEIVNKEPMTGVTIRAPLKLQDCYDARDSLAKDLFNKLFCWLVQRMNLTILPKFMLKGGNPSQASTTKTIGLLDIFGFERFKHNFFEQLLINYTNEKLHKLYISAVFDAEKVELSNEGLGHCLKNLKYPDNTGVEVIKLLDEKQRIGQANTKNGICTVTDDFSKSQPRPNFDAIMDFVMQNHGDNPKIQIDFKKDKNRDKFTIVHSAKEVKYDIKTFIVKNVDSISPSLEKIVAAKGDDQISMIYSNFVPGIKVDEDEEDSSPRGKKSNLKTIWSKFSVQMKNLMLELAEPLLDLGEGNAKKKKAVCEPCELHFLRCIKPNELKVSDFFVDSMTLMQMTYMGVLESIEVKQKNFPYRRKFQDFFHRYEDLCNSTASKRYDTLVKEGANFKKLCEEILETCFRGLANGLFAFGHKKLFLKNELVLLMEKCRTKAQEKKAYAVDVIQRSFRIKMNNSKHHDKMIKVHRIQLFWRKREEMIRAAKIKKFIDKLKDIFRRTRIQVNREKFELESRKKIIKWMRLNVFKQKLLRFSLNGKIVADLFEESWLQIREEAELKTAVTVQRIFKGFLEKRKHDKAVKLGLKAKYDCASTKALRIIQKNFRGVLVRNRLRTLHHAAAFIQGHMRMRWLSTLFQKMRFEIRKIQRCTRKFLIRKKKMKERLMEFFPQEIASLENVRNVENYAMFGEPEEDEDKNNFFKNHTPYNLKKVNLFSQIVDVQLLCDTSDVYETPWSLHWLQLSQEMLTNDTPIQRISLGSTHTLAVNSKSKLYSWGWNEFGQLGTSPDEEMKREIRQGVSAAKQLSVHVDSRNPASAFGRVKQIVSGEDHNLIRDESGNVFAFGDNSKGQLGMGHYKEIHTPTRIQALPENSVKEISTCGNQNLACTTSGKVYIWPCVKEGHKISIPQCIGLESPKTKICSVSCGYNFGVLLSTQGLVYSFGKNNSDGQLGHGDRDPRGFPEIIDSLKQAGEKVEVVDCGFRHVIARTSLGKIYTWGWGLNGQLGHGEKFSELSPRHLNMDTKKRKNKCIQIAAGYEHSVVLMENRKIYWFGRNGTLLEPTYSPAKFDLTMKIPSIFPSSDQLGGATNPNIEFIVTKINCSWNKTLSLTDIIVADIRSLENITPHQIQSALKTLSNAWCSDEIEPPYIESISKYFSVNSMKKPTIPPKTKPKPKNAMKLSPRGKRRIY